MRFRFTDGSVPALHLYDSGSPGSVHIRFDLCGSVPFDPETVFSLITDQVSKQTCLLFRVVPAASSREDMKDAKKKKKMETRMQGNEKYKEGKRAHGEMDTGVKGVCSTL